MRSRNTTDPDADFRYTDKTTGQVRVFAAKDDEAMVRSSSRATTDDLNRVVESPDPPSVSKGYNLDQGCAAVYVRPDTDSRWPPVRSGRGHGCTAGRPALRQGERQSRSCFQHSRGRRACDIRRARGCVV